MRRIPPIPGSVVQGFLMEPPNNRDTQDGFHTLLSGSSWA